MKKKNAFTLVELLAVIAILAILVIIAIPNVLNLYRNARKNTFVSDVQSIIRASEQAYVMNSMNNGNRTCFDSSTNPLEIEARENLVYVVRLSNKGKVTSIQIADNNYQILVDDSNGIEKDEIGKTYEIDARNKTTDIISCNNSFLVEGEEGSGEENAPYKIQYIEDLVELSENVDNGQNYAGKTIILSRDLDFKNKDSYKDKENSELYNQLTTGTGFTPIGTGSNYFKGNFDGKNHRIDNLYIKNTETESATLGLFGQIENSTISNLTVGGNIENGNKKSNAGMISNIKGTSKVINCINEINISSESTQWTLGGVVATLESGGNLTIENSINKGKISGGQYIGGLVGGIALNGKVTIKNSENTGLIETGSVVNSNKMIGGLLGFLNNDTIAVINNSSNKGNINCNNSSNISINCGGIIGGNNSGSTIEISKVDNEGKITINSNGSFYVGGIIGHVNGKANINNSHNKNTITSNKTDNIGNRDIGGLVGMFNSTQTSIITNSSNEKEGIISGGNRTGGLVGDCQSGLIMNNSYNEAKISSGDAWSSAIDIGGLLGSTSGWSKKHEDVVILNSYNKNNIEVNIDNYSSHAGGLVGRQISSNPSNQEDTSTNTKIINSYNQGNIIMNGNTTGGITANGIMRFDPKSVTLNNVYNIGLLNSKKDNYIIGSKNTNAIVNYKNVYYLNTLTGTKPDDTTNVIGKTASEMKNQSFVTLLNTNKNSITLTELDSRLTGYTLCDWKLGTSLYPELDCK